jgi:hypothetical protein
MTTDREQRLTLVAAIGEFGRRPIGELHDTPGDELTNLYKLVNDLGLVLGRELARRRLAVSHARAATPGTIEYEDAADERDRADYEREMSIGGKAYKVPR